MLTLGSPQTLHPSALAEAPLATKDCRVAIVDQVVRLAEDDTNLLVPSLTTSSSKPHPVSNVCVCE